MCATTAQNICPVLVGINHNRLQHSTHMHIDKLRSPANFYPNHDFTANKQLDLKVPILHTYTYLQGLHVHNDRLSANFDPNHRRLDLHFKGQRFEWSTFGSSNVIISQTVTDCTNIAIANTESCMWPLD